MGIKDLFSGNSTGVIPITSIEEEIVRNTPELESVESLREQRKRIERYIPPLDFSDPSNFARYGSAESYYKDAISRIYNQYPYDGSEREIQEFLNESNYVDLHIFEDQYPRTTGYAIFSAEGWGTQAAVTDGWGLPSSLEYISIKGGPHTSSGGIPTGDLRKAFGEPTNRTSPNANIYDNDIYGTAEVDTLDRVGSRESNLQYKLSNGISVEFWLKKDAWVPSLTEKETIFDLWNGEASSSAGYGRFLLYLTASGIADAGAAPMRLHFASGSNTVDATVLSTAYTTASIGDGNWHHYAVTLQSSSADANVEMKAYVDGALENTATTTTNFGEVTGSLIGHIAALQTTPSGDAYHGATMTGAGKLSGSIDEFRFWKSKRTERDVQRNWWTQVRGGTNTDISNADLGFYFKFNEGITGDATNDATVLDYSGRISNGVWTGYPSSNARNVGSAIDSSSATVTGTTEFKDPIIYSEHADVVSLYSTYGDSGSAHDHSNVSSILDSLPAWIVEEDEAKGSGELKKLTQIIGSYFDTLHLQVQHLPKIAEVGYPSSSDKPVPFSERLLSSFGLHAPETFVEASILEKFANRRDDREYSLDINDVKNQVYQNIYNNLNFIYKSKGTEKSFRNLIRCYGIDEEVIKLNAYGNNSTFKFEDTHYDATVRKNYIDFNHPDRFDGVVYQNSSSNSETTGISFISGTNANFASTAEAEIIFPKKMEFSNPQYFLTPFVSASLFGRHRMKTLSATDFRWQAEATDFGFQAYFIKTAEESKDGHFLLTSRRGDINLTSSVFTDVYDNQKWNIAVRVKDGKYPYAAGLTGSGDSNNVVVEFTGYNVELGVVRNSFSASIAGRRDLQLSAPARYYAGADRLNTVGAVQTKTDVRVSSVRHYAHYLEDSVLLAHAKDPTNFGVGHANKNIIFSANAAGIGIDNIDLPEYASLAMHWDFSQVTGTDAIGAFEVDDASSGSVSLQTRYSSDGNFSVTVANQHAGRGYFPSALSSTSVVDKNYVPASIQRLPEVVNSSDAVNVLTQDDDLYPSDPAVSQTFFAFEKSMFGVISQEMMNTMATVIEFNNLVGEMTNKYRGEYKDFTRLRALFFEKIENNPDLDKFIDYYKWIDNSLSVMIQQLVPASANVADEIRTVVESHIFERSKYRHKMPLLDYKGNARWGGDDLLLEARAFGINELTYDWEHGHAPISDAQNTNALWWRERAERDKTTFATAASIDAARQAINDVILSFNSASYKGKFSTIDGTSYDGSTYALRRFASPAKLTVGIDKEIRSGYNFPRTQKPESITRIIKPGSTANLQVTTGDFKGINAEETGAPILTVKRPFITETSENSKIHSPVGQFSSSLGTTEFAGLHTDAYGDHYEVSMQGPFTQEHVGGYQHRHTPLNRGYTYYNPSGQLKWRLDDVEGRQEAWEIHGGDTFTTRSSMHHPPAYSNYQRDERVKRPVNLRNIQSVTGTTDVTVGEQPYGAPSLGNYHNIYEVVQTSGRRGNNSQFVKSEGFGSSSTVSEFIESVNDYAKPARGRHAHVFVNRFSAPGGPETAGDANGGPFLDLESAEFSPYNDMNTRNLTVRKPLQVLLTERTEQFGLKSGSSVQIEDYVVNITASYHKTNKNGIKRLEFTDAENTFAAIVTASSFDNYYVQHMIPQSDYQYTWITASYVSSDTNTYGYFPANGLNRAGTNQKAIATLTVGDGNGLCADDSLAELDSITITSTDGTERKYVIINDNASTVTTGTVLEEGSDYGSGTLPAGHAAIGGIAVAVFITGSQTLQQGVLQILKTAIEHANGHAGKITMTVEAPAADGAQTATLTQTAEGSSGNKSITHAIQMDDFAKTDFSGGGFGTELISAINFVSSSEIGTSLNPTRRRPTPENIGTGYIHTDFAGINSTIITPISASDFTLGYPLDADVRQYYNFGNIGAFTEDTVNTEAFITKLSPNAGSITNELGFSLNHILSHRQGSYGHPTWKQIRVGQGALGRHYRNNNLYTHTPFGGDELKTNFANAVQTIPSRRGNTLMVSQSVVTSKYHPIKQELLVVTGEGRGKALIHPLMVMSSYANNVVYFDDPDFANKMGIKIKKGFSAYNQIKGLYLDGALKDPSSPVVGVNRVIYTETVWPSIGSAHTSKVRGRTDFKNNFWRDNRIDRTALGVIKKPTTSAGLEIAQSAWALDSYEEFQGSTLGALGSGGTGSATADGHKSGELQNEYVHYHGGDPSKVYAGALYSRKHLFPHTSSIVPAWGMDIPEVAYDANLSGFAGIDQVILPAHSFARGEAKWEAGDHAGAYEGTSSTFVKKSANPFYDSYDDYFADIKSKGKDYSIIPEFRVTDHLEFYRDQGYDYFAENEKMFSIAHVPSGTSVPQNSAEEDFFKVFTNSDFMKHFAVVRQDHEGTLDPHVLRLKCKAIKKFVPYDGFYPAERTTELVKQFMDSYGTHVTFVTGTDAGLDSFSQYTRNFIKPLFAPGLLYNTIKSGLAVDYPIMTGTYNRNFSVDITDDPTGITNAYELLATSGSFSIFSNSSAGSTGTTAKHHAGWDRRIPFEALVNPEKYLVGININDDEPSDLARVDARVNWSGEGDSVYRNMAHNFFAECANFFLEGGKTTGISSLPETSFKDVTPGQIYGMRVKLWRSMDIGKVVSGSWGGFEVPQNTREVETTIDGTKVGPDGSIIEEKTDLTAKETFTMYSRPSAFGPPLGLHSSTTSSFSGSAHDFGPRNGIYGSHTPPYYDGESWIDLIYFPQGLASVQTDDSGSFAFRTDMADLSSYQPTLGEIFSTPDDAILNSATVGVPLQGTFIRKWRYDEEELKRDSNSTYAVTGSPLAPRGPAAGPWVNKWAMQGDASLNIFDTIKEDDEKKWRIQTKFETPMLNFNQVSAASGTLTIADNLSASAALPRGMWHQFGRLPLEGEGVYMQVTDIPFNWLATHPSATLQWDMSGKYDASNKSSRVENSANVAANYRGYSVPVGDSSAPIATELVNPPISSLIDICGFNTSPVRIGEVSNSTSIREAIVAVPFIIEEGERKFFTILDPYSAEKADGTGGYHPHSGQTVIDQVEAMERYVFPPTLDFVKNAAIEPFAMYIFEFEHKFDKNDLSHMWQNLSPKIGTAAEESTSVIAHNLMASELMGDWKTLSTILSSGGALGDDDFFTPMNDRVQWMVFKVKQKAKTNYYDALNGKEEEAIATNIPAYTHNWPYDFCSIVELAKLDSEVQLGGKVEGAAKLDLRTLIEDIPLASGGAMGPSFGSTEIIVGAPLSLNFPASDTSLDPDAVPDLGGTTGTDDAGPDVGGYGGDGGDGGGGANPGDGAN